LSSSLTTTTQASTTGCFPRAYHDCSSIFHSVRPYGHTRSVSRVDNPLFTFTRISSIAKTFFQRFYRES
jgi:hypothetical protein